jgi:lipopolysaccharide/colanic/teichoic acid biosynthesis glycosyltransferase
MALTILYIGKHAPTLEKLRRYKSFSIIHEESGFSAYNMLQLTGTPPDAIIAESNLPGIRGKDVKHHLGKLLKKPVPFFLIHNNVTRDEAAQWLKEGIQDAFSTEPDPEFLERRIQFLSMHLQSGKTTNVSFTEYRTPFVKRTFDILAAGIALLLISPLLLLVILAIRMESKGKVYYISKRVGTGYRIFNFYKLRSMSTGADAKLKDLKHLNQYAANEPETEDECPDCARLGHACSPILYIDQNQICEKQYLRIKKQKNGSAFIKIKDDPRVTRVGKFIRNTSIDELPQLINILKGDMSVVGNRPLPLYEAELLTSDQWVPRFMAPAGLTGLWQTKKRGRGTMSDDERKGLDIDYARNYSFMNDLKIILMTIPALFQKENV